MFSFVGDTVLDPFWGQQQRVSPHPNGGETASDTRSIRTTLPMPVANAKSRFRIVQHRQGRDSAGMTLCKTCKNDCGKQLSTFGRRGIPRPPNREPVRGSRIKARSAVTGGKQMDGFVKLICSLLCEVGIKEACVHCERYIEVPGFFRPEKKWDLIVVVEGTLLASVEFKSQVGPSFGNNFNNRTEEALGQRHRSLGRVSGRGFSGIAATLVGILDASGRIASVHLSDWPARTSFSSLRGIP